MLGTTVCPRTMTNTIGSQGEPTTIILLNGYSHKGNCNDILSLDSQHSSEKLLFVVDGDLTQRPNQGAENQRPTSVQL